MLDEKFIRSLRDSINKFACKLYDDERDRRESERSESGGKDVGKGTHLPYGLCKKYNINLPEKATPQQAWEALKKKGVTPDETYESLEETGTVEKVQSNQEEKSNNKKLQEIIDKLNKIPGYNINTPLEKLSNNEKDIILSFEHLLNDKEFSKSNKKKEIIGNVENQIKQASDYSKSRKDSALWFTDVKKSYKEFSPNAYEVYKKLSKDEISALYKYTDDTYYPINKFLRSGGEPLGEDSYYSDSDVSKYIQDIDSVMKKSTLKKDSWFQRSIDASALVKFLDLPSIGINYLSELKPKDYNKLVGLTPIELGFMSCGASKGSGMNKEVVLNVFAPKGTHGFYVAPLSYYGGNMGKPDVTWNGEDVSKEVGGENEMLLDRNLRFKVTKFEKKDDYTYFLDIEVIPN